MKLLHLDTCLGTARSLEIFKCFLWNKNFARPDLECGGRAFFGNIDMRILMRLDGLTTQKTITVRMFYLFRH